MVSLFHLDEFLFFFHLGFIEDFLQLIQAAFCIPIQGRNILLLVLLDLLFVIMGLVFRG